MNTRKVLRKPVMRLLMIAVILLAVIGLGILISFASWLIHMHSIYQPIQGDPANFVNDFISYRFPYA